MATEPGAKHLAHMAGGIVCAFLAYGLAGAQRNPDAGVEAQAPQLRHLEPGSGNGGLGHGGRNAHAGKSLKLVPNLGIAATAEPKEPARKTDRLSVTKLQISGGGGDLATNLPRWRRFWAMAANVNSSYRALAEPDRCSGAVRQIIA